MIERRFSFFLSSILGMSSQKSSLPFQKRGGRQQFVRKSVFGDEDDQEETDQVEMVSGFEKNKAVE